MATKRVFEPEVQEYLKLKSPSTAKTYGSGFMKFLEYYRAKHGKDKGFNHFLDRIFEEFKKPQREQKRIAEIEVSQFVDYLKDKKISNNAIRLYFAAVQNFLKYKQVSISMSFINVPAPTEKKTNGKHEWTIEQVKEFVENATTYRDKAIILCMFQSGLAVNEICDLNYGDVQNELKAETLPLCLKLVRQKTQVEFKTFFGYDAVKYLKLYLATRSELKPESPLFTKMRARSGEVRMNSIMVEKVFAEIADKVEFINRAENHYNPARPHSLRAAFNSRLMGKIDETLREFWMGHAIGGVAKAYLVMPTEEMRKLYLTAEEYLCIEKTSREENENKVKVVKLPPETQAEIKILKDEVEKQRSELTKLQTQLKSAVAFIYSLEPLINNITADEKEHQERVEAQEEFNKMTAELLKENPIPKKDK
jgi:site-specific recombinase XerD